MRYLHHYAVNKCMRRVCARERGHLCVKSRWNGWCVLLRGLPASNVTVAVCVSSLGVCAASSTTHNSARRGKGRERQAGCAPSPFLSALDQAACFLCVLGGGFSRALLSSPLTYFKRPTQGGLLTKRPPFRAGVFHPKKVEIEMRSASCWGRRPHLCFIPRIPRSVRWYIGIGELCTFWALSAAAGCIGIRLFVCLAVWQRRAVGRVAFSAAGLTLTSSLESTSSFCPIVCVCARVILDFIELARNETSMAQTQHHI